MGTYGIGFYGVATYGTDIHPDFDVSPFTATPVDYSSVLLNWKAPAGAWDTLRLIRNRHGWAVNENDGEVLLEQNHLSTAFLDTGVVGGHWLYYTIYIQASGQWSRAGTVSTLMPKNSGYSDLLYSLMPEYYKVNVAAGNNLTDDSNTLNPDLGPFLSIFGFGFDIVRSYYDSNRYTNDAMRTRYDNIQKMAEQFGIQFEASTPAYLFRQRVRDAATLGRQKGTVEQLRSLISETTGYDADIHIAPNLMLSDDQADFDHPTYAQWDPAVNYASGERAVFGSFLYQAASSGAYGQSQAPSGTSSSNAYWTVVAYGTDTTLVDANGHVAGWEEISFTGGVSPGTAAILTGVGVQNPVQPSDNTGNALWVRNTSSGGTTATFGVRSVGRLSGQSSMDPNQPVLYGIPVPQAYVDWDGSTYYRPGDLVRFHGRTFLAVTASRNAKPLPNSGYGEDGYGEGVYGGVQTGLNPWSPLSYDDRVQMCLSGYAQAYSGQQVPVYPFVEYYDSHGSLICSLYADAVPSYTVLDSFSQTWIGWVGRTTDVGGLTWTEAVGQWTAGGYAGGAAYPTGTGRALATLTGHADGSVAVTFATTPSGSAKQGLVFRYQDTSTYWRAGRTALYRIASGSVAATYPYASSCSDGDRLTVAYSGSNIAVQKNGTQVLTITDSTLSTATGVGMVVE